jgi:hypothetical protein
MKGIGLRAVRAGRKGVVGPQPGQREERELETYKTGHTVCGMRTGKTKNN